MSATLNPHAGQLSYFALVDSAGVAMQTLLRRAPGLTLNVADHTTEGGLRRIRHELPHADLKKYDNPSYRLRVVK